jgi:hypothetical protein
MVSSPIPLLAPMIRTATRAMLSSDPPLIVMVRSRRPHRKMDARPEHTRDELIVPALPKDRRVITGSNQLAVIRCPLFACAAR